MSIQDLKERVDRDNAKYVNSFVTYQNNAPEFSKQSSWWWNSRLIDALAKERSVSETIVFTLAIFAIMAVCAIIACLIVEQYDAPELSRQVVADSIGAARYAESVAAE